MRMELIEMGHGQPPTLEVTDSTTGDGFLMKISANNVQDQLTYNFTGSDTEPGKDNFWYIGWLKNIIW